MKKIANTFSVLFHPLFMPVYALLLLMYIPTKPASFLVNDSLYYLTPRYKSVLLVIFAIFTIIAPMISLFFFKINKVISSYTLDNQKERTAPIFMMSAYLLFLFGMLQYRLAEFLPQIVILIALSGAVSLLFAGIINFRFKISLHLIGMGVLSAVILNYYQHQIEFNEWVLLGIIIFSGVLASMRIFLKAHTLSETVVAYLLGFSCQLLCAWAFA